MPLDIGEQFQIKPAVGIRSLGTLGDIISAILPNIYVLAGIILFILLIIGGFGIIMGAGEENPEKAKKGKQAITAALIGFLIIFASWWIIQIVEVITGVDILGGGGL
jgi:hypothetical protein